jgi:hypothetical protein
MELEGYRVQSLHKVHFSISSSPARDRSGQLADVASETSDPAELAKLQASLAVGRGAIQTPRSIFYTDKHHWRLKYGIFQTPIKYWCLSV